MIDIALRLTLADATRRFELAVRFATDAPVMALYGPSGAGKSLTLQAIAGLLKPSAGHVRIAGRTLFDSEAGVDLPAAERRVGYLFQDYALFPHLSVRQNVAFGLTTWHQPRLKPADAERVDALIASFGLAEMAQARPSALSGGQRQRVALARALACDPAVLLLDEPFAALNPMLRASLRQELAEVRQRWNIPMLMITHDIEDVMALADAVCVIDQGQVLREMDLRSGDHRERAWEVLSPEQAAPDARSLRLRALLGQPGRT
ncbi:MAG: ATP-binding cassette domain-containing protein [Vitreoscilla sp.]|nr:ATP-binding cassette domain-containing protein [Vitreoscilla sp.]MBP6677301.1 ATP-binding cassette domain-containing protein [Vitreoscilla sp.]